MLPQNKLKISLSLSILAAALWLMHSFIPALLWAVVIAIATWPVRVKVAQRTRLKAVGVALLMSSMVGVLLFIPIVYAFINAVSDLGALTRWVMDARQAGIAVPEWLGKLPVIAGQAINWWQVNLTDPAGLSLFLDNAGWLKAFMQTAGTQLAHRLITLIFTVVTLFFLYESGESVSGKTLALLEKLTGEMGRRYGLLAASAIRATVNGVVLVGLAEGLLIGISYWIAGAPHAAIFGLITGALAMIPFAAPLIFTGISLYLLAQGNLIAAAAVFLFSMLVLAIGDHLVRPRIIGSSVELPFLWVLFGIMGGVEVFGLIGLFIGPALMALVLMMWNDLTESTN